MSLPYQIVQNVKAVLKKPKRTPIVQPKQQSVPNQTNNQCKKREQQKFNDSMPVEQNRATIFSNQKIADIAKSLPNKLIKSEKDMFKTSKPILPSEELKEYVDDLEK